MKLFSNLLASIAMLSMLSLATACENSSTLPEQPTTPEPEYVTVSLGLNVGLDCEYEPLLRSNENNDLYGIQVYSTPIPATADSEWAPFAYGLFDNVDNLTIKLVRSFEYKFVVAMVKDGKDKTYCKDGEYGEPFHHFTGVGEFTPISESFIYGPQYLTYLTDKYRMRHLNVELYYGELGAYIPGDNDSKATIEINRISFGAKYKVTGEYAENGTLEIIMPEAVQLNINLAEGNEVSEIYTFTKMRAAWLDENYTETEPVTLRIAYADGTSAPLGTHDITFKRNTTTVVNVDMSIGGEDGVGIVVTEEGEMPEEEITIKDGEIVDTEIETN